jgi:integrase
MKVVERVRFGSRGQGCLIRYAGAAWYSNYFVAGQGEVRESTGETDFKRARAFHKRRLDQVGSHRAGHKKFVRPSADRVLVKDLLGELEKDAELRGLRSWAQTKPHLEPVKVAFGDWRASQVTAAAIDDYITTRLATKTTRGTTTAPATVNRELANLGRALRLALERGTLSAMPKIRRLREQNTRLGFFERAELEAVVAALPDDLRDFTRFAYLTGWRKGEVTSLTWADVDRDGGVIRLRPEESKNGHGRTIAVEGDLKPLMERRWQARQLPGPNGTTRMAAHVFHRDGAAVGDIRKSWASACDEAGVSGRLFHDLRRSAIRNMVRAGVPERVAMTVSGHKTRSVFDRYNIVSEDDLRRAMQKASDYVNAQPKTATVTPIAQAR